MGEVTMPMSVDNQQDGGQHPEPSLGRVHSILQRPSCRAQALEMGFDLHQNSILHRPAPQRFPNQYHRGRMESIQVIMSVIQTKLMSL